MQAILAPLAAADGVACFLRLYLAVTEGVAMRLRGVTFHDPAFVAALDERFAGLFFAAVTGPPPPAWAPLFDARGRHGIAPLQFALAGMNAHINRDLPVAIVGTATASGARSLGPFHDDYVTVNGVLAAVEASVRAAYAPRRGLLGLVDHLAHRWHHIDDVVAMWDVARARDAAWTNAEALWALRDEPPLAARFLDTLDRTVGMAGRGLLAA